jgi:hypothetical protein
MDRRPQKIGTKKARSSSPPGLGATLGPGLLGLALGPALRPERGEWNEHFEVGVAKPGHSNARRARPARAAVLGGRIAEQRLGEEDGGLRLSDAGRAVE